MALAVGVVEHGGVEDEGHAQGGHVHRGAGQAAGGLGGGAGTTSYRNGRTLKNHSFNELVLTF